MRKLVIGLVLFAAGLLIGFIPQYSKARHFEGQANSCNARLELGQIQRSAALAYVSATQQNYGTAAGYANQLFDQAQQLSGSKTDPAVHAMLADVLSARDKIMNDLSKANAQVVSELQPIVLEIHGASNR
jgi:RecA/RadA recombinase